MSAMNFLVVNESVTMRKIVVNTLKKLGYENTIEAENGRDAFARMYSETIHFIITGWNMPGMNGLQLIKAVRGDDSFKEMPIIMLTARGEKEDIIAAMKAGANNYIVKPIQPSVLQSKIDQILRNEKAK